MGDAPTAASMAAAPSTGAEQRKRRHEVLQTQKVKRQRIASEGGCSSDALLTAVPTAMDTTVKPSEAKASHNRASETLMAAEWMVDVPVDLGSSWCVAARPAGKRCLVSTSGGSTRVQGRTGRARTFPSTLPGGSRHSKGGSSAVCELDCIWVEDEAAYYVVDVLRWKQQRLADCPAELRLFWLHSKLIETRCGESSSTNRFRFVPLKWVPCDAQNLRAAYAARDGSPTEPADPERAHDVSSMDLGAEIGDGASGAGRAQRDGLLFMHREALYEPGPSPLFLSWCDRACSSRFYDYGSVAMAKELQRAPEKVEKWRAAEVTAAVDFAQLMQRAETPMPMEQGVGP